MIMKLYKDENYSRPDEHFIILRKYGNARMLILTTLCGSWLLQVNDKLSNAHIDVFQN